MTTATNSTGEAVVLYFSGQKNRLPFSCNLFQKMEDDNSYNQPCCVIGGEMTAHSTLESGDTTTDKEKTGCTAIRHLILNSITDILVRVNGFAMMAEMLNS